MKWQKLTNDNLPKIGTWILTKESRYFFLKKTYNTYYHGRVFK